MDVFRRKYNTYYLMLRFTGLWPLDDSIFPKIQRTFFSVFTLCCILIQVNTIRQVEMTLSNILTLLSYACPMLLYWLRYLGFVTVFPLVKTIVQSISNDCVSMRNPVEAKILEKYIDKTRTIILMFLGLSIVGMSFIAFRVLTPTLLRSEYQLYSLRFYGFFYSEQNKQADWASVHLTLTSAIGLLTIACTEGFLAVFSLYLCGLFEIVGYRIRKTVDNAAQLITSKPIDVGPAMEVHQRAFTLAKSAEKSMMLSYLLAIMMVIVSFAVNLYRASLLILEMNQLDETIMSFLVVLTHLVVMFLNNYSGQQLANISINVFNETHNSLWYCVPLESQKTLLFILMKSSTEVQFNLAGLFIPCYEGFATMMSSSFSYFTVLYSV
ncbi:uncharacterized protein LOC143361052 isoform X2 [Halictus rubicundus]|uniref:uncharacterized protein LOC143361052 isoform X2 n=1 Tax=Halictus rubicundus TaxID=77578 RepID=UPI004036C0AF